MRLNIYAEEVTTETRVIAKTSVQPDGARRTFYGVGLFLASPDVLHHTPDDDDRSCVTLWVPWTAEKGHDFEHVAKAIRNLMGSLATAMDMERADRVG